MGGLGLKNDPKQLDIIFIYECSPSRRAMLWVRALGSSINNVTTILKKRGEGGLKMEEKLMMNVVLKTVGNVGFRDKESFEIDNVIYESPLSGSLV